MVERRGEGVRRENVDERLIFDTNKIVIVDAIQADDNNNTVGKDAIEKKGREGCPVPGQQSEAAAEETKNEVVVRDSGMACVQQQDED